MVQIRQMCLCTVLSASFFVGAHKDRGFFGGDDNFGFFGGDNFFGNSMMRFPDFDNNMMNDKLSYAHIGGDGHGNKQSSSQVIQSSSSSWSSSSKTDKDGNFVTATQNSVDMSSGPYDTQQKACAQCLSSVSDKSGLVCMAIGEPGSYYARGSTPDVVHSLGFVDQAKSAKQICQCSAGKNNECRDVNIKMLEKDAKTKEGNHMVHLRVGKKESSPKAIENQKAGTMIEDSDRKYVDEKSEDPIGQNQQIIPARSQSALLPMVPTVFSDDMPTLFSEHRNHNSLWDHAFGASAFDNDRFFSDDFGGFLGPKSVFREDDGLMRQAMRPFKPHLRGGDYHNDKDGGYSYSMSSSSSYSSNGKDQGQQVTMTGRFGPYDNEIQACDVCFSKNPNPKSVGCMASIVSAENKASFAEFATPNVMLSKDFRGRAGTMCGCLKDGDQTKCDTRLHLALDAAAQRMLAAAKEKQTASKAIKDDNQGAKKHVKAIEGSSSSEGVESEDANAEKHIASRKETAL